MRARAIEIAWHEKAPIWSVDVSPSNRLVTAGGDKVARVWHLSPSASAPELPVEWLCDLRAHLTTVNVARFSHSGLSIATGADQGEIVVWRLSSGTEAATALSPLEAAAEGTEGAPAPRERWGHEATLRGHHQDVLDLSWASDGYTLVSGSVDNTIDVWDTRNPNRPPTVLRAHSNFVQGVAIDPVGKIIASLGNDRALRLFSRAGLTPWSPVAVATAITADAKLFSNDTNFKTFFRRLAWSPDGSVLACPSGLHFPQTKRMFAVHLFARNHWSLPAAQCGGLTKPACAVRFSPVLYALRKEVSSEENVATPEAQSQSCTASQSSHISREGTSKEDEEVRHRKKFVPFEGFTYRMVFAVACVDAVFFYDTEAFSRPFATVEGLHCAEHTDIAWSPDGLTVVLSSVDGYASTITFTEEELGPRLREDQMPRWLKEYTLQRQHSETGVLIKATRVSPLSARPPSFLSTIRRSTSVKELKPGSPLCSPKIMPDRRILGQKKERLPTETFSDMTGLTPALSEAQIREAKYVTLRKSSGQGFRIAAAGPTETAVEVEQVQLSDSKSAAMRESVGPEKEPEHRIDTLEGPKIDTIRRVQEPRQPEVRVVFPKRRLKQPLSSPGLGVHPSIGKGKQTGMQRGMSSLPKQSNEVVDSEAPKLITKLPLAQEKRRLKSGSLVQTKFAANLVPEIVEEDGREKRNRDSVDASVEDQAKRHRRESVLAIDLT